MNERFIIRIGPQHAPAAGAYVRDVRGRSAHLGPREHAQDYPLGHARALAAALMPWAIIALGADVVVESK